MYCVDTSSFLPMKIYTWTKSYVVLRKTFKLNFYQRLFYFMTTYCVWTNILNICRRNLRGEKLQVFYTYLCRCKIYTYGDKNVGISCFFFKKKTNSFTLPLSYFFPFLPHNPLLISFFSQTLCKALIVYHQRNEGPTVEKMLEGTSLVKHVKRSVRRKDSTQKG